jgi:hypothetical protein
MAKACEKTAPAWPQMMWFADCVHCEKSNAVDRSECLTNEEHSHTCTACGVVFKFSARISE